MKWRWTRERHAIVDALGLVNMFTTSWSLVEPNQINLLSIRIVKSKNNVEVYSANLLNTHS